MCFYRLGAYDHEKGLPRMAIILINYCWGDLIFDAERR